MYVCVCLSARLALLHLLFMAVCRCTLCLFLENAIATPTLSAAHGFAGTQPHEARTPHASEERRPFSFRKARNVRLAGRILRPESASLHRERSLVRGVDHLFVHALTHDTLTRTRTSPTHKNTAARESQLYHSYAGCEAAEMA